MIKIFGQPPINSYLYYSGKLATYLAWIFLALQFLGVNFRVISVPGWLTSLALILAAAGLLLFLVSSLNLGASLRFGLPAEETAFKSAGLYAFSRNPMYLGFFLLLIASVIYTASPLVLLLALYGGYVHYRITLGEEEFMRGRFGRLYLDYCAKTRRYI